MRSQGAAGLPVGPEHPSRDVKGSGVAHRLGPPGASHQYLVLVVGVRDLPRAFISLNGVVPIYYHKAIIFQIDPQQWRLNLPSHATVPVRRCSL
jgi:hypothetical protein